MPDVQTPTAPATPPTQPDPKQTAANIVKGIQDRANGKAPATPPHPPITGEQKPPADPNSDPNAGKEKYVVEGREVWLTPEQAKSYVQKGLSFEPRVTMLDRLQQEQAIFMRALLTDPGRVLQNLAAQNKIPIRNLVQSVLASNAASDEIKEEVGKWFYENAVEPMKLTPEQLKAREDAKWRAEHEAKEKDREAAQIRQENQAKVAKAMDEIKAFIHEAMKESELADPNTPLGGEMARQVAEVMRVARVQRQALTPKQAIEFVKQRITGVNSAYYESKVPSDQNDPKYIEKVQPLISLLGDKVVQAVQLYLVKKAQTNGGVPPTVPKGEPKPRSRNGERSTINLDQFHDYLDQLKKEG